MTTIFRTSAILVTILGLVPVRLSGQSKDESIFEGTGVPPAILALLNSSCEKCHSDAGRRTSRRILPAVAGQLTAEAESNGFLNFSRWSQYKKRERRGYLLSIASSVSSGLMPPRSRVWNFGRRGRLSAVERKMIADWADDEAKRVDH